MSSICFLDLIILESNLIGIIFDKKMIDNNREYTPRYFLIVIGFSIISISYDIIKENISEKKKKHGEK